MGTLLAAAHAHRGRSAATNTELARAAEKLALLCERGWPRALTSSGCSARCAAPGWLCLPPQSSAQRTWSRR
ncbi:hypothetical protein WJX81_001402 [Elliptochloris bilobata]|uniref:Uncharacterized protein n=1 Tax=Elliptochloris bilobata TaxID=381761 RepID=A0AAW1QZB2_9CHLO